METIKARKPQTRQVAMSIRRIATYLVRHFLPRKRGQLSYLPVGDVYRGEAAEQYLERRAAQDYWILEQRTMERLLASVPTGLTVLDVPFGTGRFAPLYLARGLEVFGLDSSPDMLSVARRELKADFSRCNTQLGDAQRLPYRDGAFDLVVCFRFLSHVVSLAQVRVVLAELRRVARWRAFVQLRVRRDELPPAAAFPQDEVIGDRLFLQDLAALLSEHRLAVRELARLEDRPTYYRAIFVCDAQ